MQLDQKQIKNLAQKLPVRAVTTAALAANTYSNGTSGFGATLTASANGALAAVDGVTLTVGDRLLVKNEATQANNGIYVVTQLGDASHPYILTRANDCNSATNIFPGITVNSTNDGTTNGQTDFILSTITNPVVVGTTALTFVISKGLSSSKPVISNKNMAASATSADGQAACATAIAFTAGNGGYVRVYVNGVATVLGDGVKTTDCYFSGDGGTTARSIASIVTGDILYWNGSKAGYQLATTDIIDFDGIA